MTTEKTLIAVASLALAGCWTFNETPYPTVEISAAPDGTNVTVAVTGFAATLTDYATVHEFHTVYVPGYVGRRYYRPGYFETVPTVAYIPQSRPTDMFLRRAKRFLSWSGADGVAVGMPRAMSCRMVSAVVCENKESGELTASAACGDWKAEGISHVERWDTSSHFSGNSPSGAFMKSAARRCHADLR